MRFVDDPNPAMSPERPAVPGRWLGRSLVAAFLVTASLAVTACGSSESPTILNTEKIERAIEQSSLAQRGTPAQVSCPSGMPQTKGWVFSCTALTQHGSTRFVVTELDESGHVHYEAP
jgi:hypothetical protein